MPISQLFDKGDEYHFLKKIVNYVLAYRTLGECFSRSNLACGVHLDECLRKRGGKMEMEKSPFECGVDSKSSAPLDFSSS